MHINVHFLCKQFIEILEYATVASGYDIKPHTCKECDTELIRDGQNITYQTFLELEGKRALDIDLNLDP